MDRRDYLALLGTGIAGALAGCSQVSAPGDGNASETSTTTNRSSPRRRGPRGDISLPVPKSKLRRSVPRDAIPAIVDPEYGPDWSEVSYRIDSASGDSYQYDPTLSNDEKVIGLVRDGQPRAYPLTLLNRHEVANHGRDDPYVVTYCPVCRSGIVASRRVEGQTLTFGVSGYLFRANLVLYDQETESLWSQLLATAIRGPKTGTELGIEPSRLTNWSDWQAEHPDTTVLLPPPESSTVLGDLRLNYNVDLQGRMRDIQERFPEYGALGNLNWSDTRLRRRTLVVGVAAGGEATAYPLRTVRSQGPINDVVGGRPVVVTMAGEDSATAYDRRVRGVTLRFVAGPDGALVAGGSRWNPRTGEALDGPFHWATLDSATDGGPLFWAAWLQFNPGTTVYGE